MEQHAWGQLNNVKIQTIQGQTFQGTVNSIDASGVISGTFAPAGPPLNVSDLLSVESGLKPEKQDYAVRVIPATGGEIGADSVTIAEDRIRINTNGQQHNLSVQSIRAVIWSGSESIEQRIGKPSKENDVVIVDVKQQEREVSGLLESVSSAELGINFQGKSRTIGMEKIKALIMADLGFPPPPAPAVTVQTRDGSQWIGTLQTFKENLLTVKLNGDSLVSLRGNDITSLQIKSDRVEYLSSADPVETRETSDFVPKRSWQRNRSVLGNPLRLREENGQITEFANGLGVQARSELSFDNSNRFDRFRAVVGIDVETNGKGDCEVTVRGDGIELWSRRVAASDAPIPVDIDIDGIRQITLIVQPGREFDLSDHLNWCNARFLKTRN